MRNVYSPAFANNERARKIGGNIIDILFLFVFWKIIARDFWNGGVFNVKNADYLTVTYNRVFSKMDIHLFHRPCVGVSDKAAVLHFKRLAVFQALDGIRVAAGDENLPVFNVVENIILPWKVKLTHNIVKQRNGLFPGEIFNNRRLGKLQGKRGGALLSLRAERTRGNAVNFYRKIVPVRTDRGKAGRNVRFAWDKKKIFKVLIYFLLVLAESGAIFLIWNTELFLFWGNTGINILAKARKCVDVADSLSDNFAAVERNALLPDVKQALKLGMEIAVF